MSKCNVCNGTGKKVGFNGLAFTLNTHITGSPLLPLFGDSFKVECEKCNGKGEIHDKTE